MSARVPPNRGGAFETWTVRLLLPALLLALAFSLATGFRDRPLVDWRAWFDGPERGTWRALTLNGQEVFEEKFLIGIADGAVTGGRDGCNYWGFGEEDAATGERSITSTLAACEPTPAMAVYGVLAFGAPEMTLQGESRLVLSEGRCRGVFRRWTRDDEDAERAREEAEMEALRQREQRERSSSPQPVPPPAIVPPAGSPPPPPAPPPPPPANPAPVLPSC